MQSASVIVISLSMLLIHKTTQTHVLLIDQILTANVVPLPNLATFGQGFHKTREISYYIRNTVEETVSTDALNSKELRREKWKGPFLLISTMSMKTHAIQQVKQGILSTLSRPESGYLQEFSISVSNVMRPSEDSAQGQTLG